MITYRANFAGSTGGNLSQNPIPSQQSIFKDAKEFLDVDNYSRSTRRELTNSNLPYSIFENNAIDDFGITNQAYLFSVQELFARYFMLSTMPMLNFYRLAQIVKNVGEKDFSNFQPSDIDSFTSYNISYNFKDENILSVTPYINGFYEEYKKLSLFKLALTEQNIDFPELTTDISEMVKTFPALIEIRNMFKKIMGFGNSFAYLFSEDTYATHIYGYSKERHQYAVFTDGLGNKSFKRLLYNSESEFMTVANIINPDKL
jgi:hypothetical protein